MEVLIRVEGVKDAVINSVTSAIVALVFSLARLSYNGLIKDSPYD
jgi:hypothetical protein